MKFNIKQRVVIRGCIYTTSKIREVGLIDKIKHVLYVDHIVDKLYYTFIQPVKTLVGRIDRVISYLPIIWNDYEWDFQGIYELLLVKLTRMEPVIRNGICVKSKKSAKEIRICIQLLKRLTRDSYFDDENRNNWSHKSTKSFIIKQGKIRVQDRELLFKLMSKHVDTWWD